MLRHLRDRHLAAHLLLCLFVMGSHASMTFAAEPAQAADQDAEERDVKKTKSEDAAFIQRTTFKAGRSTAVSFDKPLLKDLGASWNGKLPLAVQIRAWLESLEHERLEQIRQKFSLSDEQCQKLRVASQGDMKDKQRDALLKMLCEQTQPPQRFGFEDFNVILCQLWRLPRNQVQEVFTDSQWRKLQTLGDKVLRMEPELIEQGLLPPTTGIPPIAEKPRDTGTPAIRD